ncbi:MAG: alpha/beta fold hydrolase [Gemmatimonadota bacterium]|nr:alpha/beta fold hydrolase [Gemmatimonadota bacterium]MDH5284704.1 alpha/beta fold hydrolase [Gemmatimonadota bacterium]
MSAHSGATLQVSLEGGLALAGGRLLRPCVVGLRRLGTPGRPAVLVLGGISAGRDVATGTHPAGWWERHVGPGRPFDTDRFEIIGFDWLGGRGSTTAPTRGESFPAISTSDQAAAIVAACEQAGVGPFHAVVGASYGGMVALALAERFPRWTRRIVVVSAPARSHPMAIGLRDLQRRIVRLGLSSGHETECLALARGVALTTYRTSREFRGRFPHAPGVPDLGVESYLERHGRQFAESWVAEQFLCLSESMDQHSVDPSSITVPALFAGVRSDTLVPAWQLRQLHRQWGGPSRLALADSRYGHDAFLKEPQFIAGVIEAGLTDQETLCTSTPSPRAPASSATPPSEPWCPPSTSAPPLPSRSSERLGRTTTRVPPIRPGTC